jgi:hypothetical protein
VHAKEWRTASATLYGDKDLFELLKLWLFQVLRQSGDSPGSKEQAERKPDSKPVLNACEKANAK